MADNRRILRFGDGSSKFADPTQYFSAAQLGALTPGSNVDPAITRAYQNSLAAAISTAAAKSARGGAGR